MNARQDAALQKACSTWTWDEKAVVLLAASFAVAVWLGVL